MPSIIISLFPFKQSSLRPCTEPLICHLPVYYLAGLIFSMAETSHFQSYLVYSLMSLKIMFHLIPYSEPSKKPDRLSDKEFLTFSHNLLLSYTSSLRKWKTKNPRDLFFLLSQILKPSIRNFRQFNLQVTFGLSLHNHCCDYSMLQHGHDYGWPVAVASWSVPAPSVDLC